MNIKFKRLQVHNFLSFGDADIGLNPSGYTIVRGINHVVDDMASSNGSGKSSIWEAISYALTGETIRGTKDVVNINAEGGCYVKLTFDIDNTEYEILRSKEHKEYKTNLKVYVNGEDKSGKGIRDTEKLLKEYLPDLTSSLIGSVIILGQGLPQRFSNNTPSGRKEVLEKLSKSDFMIADLKDRISAYKKSLSDDLRVSEDNILKLTTEQTTLENQINDNKKKIELYSDTDSLTVTLSTLKSQLQDKQSELSVTNEKLDSAKIELEKSQNCVQEEITNYSQRVKSANESEEYANKESFAQQLVEEQTSLNALNKQLKEMQSITDVCPTCGQKLIGVEKPDTSQIEYQIELLNNSLQQTKLNKSNAELTYNAMLSNLENEHKLNLDSLNRVLNMNKELVNRTQNYFNNLNSEINTLTLRCNDIQSKLDVAVAVIETLTNDIHNAEQKIVDNNEKLLYNNNVKENIEEKLSIVNKLNSIITRDFRGVLLGNAIEFINKKAKEYSKDVFDTEKIEFKLDGNNISISYDNKEYENLSGGERQKVDLIVQFALRDMLCTHLGFSSNILVLDELFDNLDDIGCQRVLNLIANKLTDVESIFIVTHHTTISIPYDNEIIVEKGEDKISRVK